jgi:hypothetical protein
MLVSGICQKILVSRLDKYPSPIGSRNLSSLSTSIAVVFLKNTTALKMAGKKITMVKEKLEKIYPMKIQHFYIRWNYE